MRRTLLLSLVVALCACRPTVQASATTPAQAEVEPSAAEGTAAQSPPSSRPPAAGSFVALTDDAYGAYKYAPDAPHVGDVAPALEARLSTGEPFVLAQAVKAQRVMLLFYRGDWWPACNTQLGQLQTVIDKYETRGVRVVAISVDPPETSAAWAASKGLTFDLACDPTYENIRRWGLENPDVEELALHAAYLIERDGSISYRKIARRRVGSPELLAAIDGEATACCAGSCKPGPVCRPL